MCTICILVEGNLDEAVARKIIRNVGGQPGTVFPKKGASYIKKNIRDYNLSAQGIPILSLVDMMDVDPDCAPEAVETWLPYRHDQMLLRFVVREIESWILADRTSLSRFLGIRKSIIPYLPENLPDPKSSLISCARSSPKDGLRAALVPDNPTSNAEGPAYTTRMERFVRKHWDLNRAMENARSLHRCVEAVKTFVDKEDKR